MSSDEVVSPQTRTVPTSLCDPLPVVRRRGWSLRRRRSILWAKRLQVAPRVILSSIGHMCERRRSVGEGRVRRRE